jgi:hypothetical protein
MFRVAISSWPELDKPESVFLILCKLMVLLDVAVIPWSIILEGKSG